METLETSIKNLILELKTNNKNSFTNDRVWDRIYNLEKQLNKKRYVSLITNKSINKKIALSYSNDEEFLEKLTKLMEGKNENDFFVQLKDMKIPLK